MISSFANRYIQRGGRILCYSNRKGIYIWLHWKLCTYALTNVHLFSSPHIIHYTNNSLLFLVQNSSIWKPIAQGYPITWHEIIPLHCVCIRGINKIAFGIWIAYDSVIDLWGFSKSCVTHQGSIMEKHQKMCRLGSWQDDIGSVGS